uniref:Uncharacterized protein n=1 Tax=Anguilla anguilla TaxID=7936 RepID=A0A0E9V631_ANGAN
MNFTSVMFFLVLLFQSFQKYNSYCCGRIKILKYWIK